MIHFRIDITGWRRVRELYDEVEQKESEIWALKKGEHFHEVQRKGWGKDFERLLKEQAELENKLKAVEEDREEWIRKYKCSEEARKDLGDKLVKAARDNARLEQALDVIRGPLQQKGERIATPACALARNDSEDVERALDGAIIQKVHEESIRFMEEQERRIATPVTRELAGCDNGEGGAEA